MNSALLWSGPTQLPGQTGQIAAVVTGIRGTSLNRKTGPMAQVWYIPVDQGPLVGGEGAVLGGRDRAVCGSCKHRPSDGGVCYVDVPSGPQRVLHTYERGAYPRPSRSELRELLRGKAVRFGAYGEPPSIPLDVYADILPVLGSWQGYTHAWSHLDVRDWGWLMASTDSRAETAEARARGWRTFRVRLEGEPLEANERVCPAAEEAGSKLTCMQCRQCNGSLEAPGRPSRVIVAHGFRSARFPDVARQLRLFGEQPPDAASLLR